MSTGGEHDDRARERALQSIAPHVEWARTAIAALEPDPRRRGAQLLFAMAHACREVEVGSLDPRSGDFEDHLVALVVEAVRIIDLELPVEFGGAPSEDDRGLHELPLDARIVYVLHELDRRPLDLVARVVSADEREVARLLEQARAYVRSRRGA